MNKLVIIIPFFNEQNRMNTANFETIFKSYTDVDFLLIDDGSNDKTFSMINGFSSLHENVATLQLQVNKGKAEAIRNGVLTVNNYEYVAYLDADLATPVSELIRLFEIAKTKKQFSFFMGSRIKLIGNQVQRNLVRHYFGRVFATIISQLVLKTPIYDTQCGAKIIKLNLAKQLFKDEFKTKWLFDVELLLRLKKLDYYLQESVLEIPLEIWEEKGNSKIKAIEFFMFPFQILKIIFAYAK
jgi:glycosyltransferase involved in cell wall biosynthesis